MAKHVKGALNFWAVHTSSTQLASGDIIFFHDSTGSMGPLRHVDGVTLPLYMNSAKATGGITVAAISPEALECVWKGNVVRFKPGPIAPMPPHQYPRHWVVI